MTPRQQASWKAQLAQLQQDITDTLKEALEEQARREAMFETEERGG
mgnify:CR=1 FL=1